MSGSTLTHRCSVVIPTLNRSELLKNTLDALNRQTETDFEIVVVCDGPDAETLELSRNYSSRAPIVWLFQPVNRGQAAARNEGATAASGETLIFLDDDVSVGSAWISEHLRCKAPRTAVRGVVVEEYRGAADSKLETRLRLERARSLARFHDAYRQPGSDFEEMACFGVNCSIDRTLFLESGGFDANLERQGEDFELGRRLYARGIRFRLSEEAIATHHNTKALPDYERASSKVAGRNTAYRVFRKRERSSQTRALTRIRHAPLLTRLAHDAAWESPETFGFAEELFRTAMNATGAEVCFQMWQRSQWGLFWSGVREAGWTRSELFEAIGEPPAALMFHSVDGDQDPLPPSHMREFSIRERTLERFLRALRALGYRSLSCEEFLEPQTPKAALLVFDDGYENFYTHAFPVLESLKLRSTVMLVAGRIGGTNAWETNAPARRLMTIAQIRELSRLGIDFGSHSATHPILTTLDDSRLRHEIVDSKHMLEDLLGKTVRSFTYPFGIVDERVRAMVAEAGYEVAFTTEEGMSVWPDPLYVRRVNIGGRDTMLDFLWKVMRGCSARRRIKMALPPWIWRDRAEEASRSQQGRAT